MKLKSLLKGVVRAAGALVGSQIGGPAGAAIGAGLATKLTGGSNQEAVLGGLVSGIGAYALPKVGEKLGLSSEGLFGAPAGAGGDMGYINSEAGSGGGMTRGIANLATSPAGLAALGAGTFALAPSERPAATSPTAPARDNRTLEQMGYDTSPLERNYRPYEGDPYAYGETGAEQRFFARGGRVRRGIAHFDDGGAVSLDAISDAGYDASSVDASGGIAGALSGTGFSFDADSGVSTPPAPVDFSVPEGITVPAMTAAPAAAAPARSADTSIIGRGLSFLQNQAQDVMNNPGRTAVNIAASGIPVVGQLNTVSGLLGGPTIGAGLMSAIQGMTGYGKGGSGVPGDADGDGVITPGDDYANYGDFYGGNGAPDSVTYDPLSAGKDAAQVGPGTGFSSLQPVGSGTPDAGGAGLQGIGRSYLSPSFDAYHYGEVMPEARFYAARGGLARGPSPAHLAMAAFERGGKVSGPGDGQSDDIPAMLSDGEYVMDADTVAALGNGSNEAGAKKLDAMRKRIRAQKRRAPVGKIPPKAKGLGHYLGGAV